MSVFTHLFRAFYVLLLATLPAFAEEPVPTPSPSEAILLPPIVTEGTPAEALKFDPVVPALSGKTKSSTSTGNVAKDISNDLPFHSNSNLKPGNEVGFVGIGKGSEETDVNVLGLPLNRPQGGGADLAIFPQYFWSGYSYQIGPSLGAFDPRGVSGSLSLRLWTQDAIGNHEQKVTAFHSSRGNGLQQFSYGRSGEKYAALVGLSTGDVFGPALALAAIPYETGSTKVTTHLLFVDMKVEGFQSERTPSTTAEQRTDRVIPVVQIDQKFAEKTLLKTSFFYDFTFVNYEVPTSATSKQLKRTHQFGNESALILGDTRLGLALRSVSYERDATDAIENLPAEQILNLQASHQIRTGGVLIEPTLGGTAVTRKGFFPYGTLGVRHDIGGENSVFGQFARVGMHKRFASLTDRYYEFLMVQGQMTLQAIPNPALSPENVRSVEAGIDYKKEGFFKTQLTGFARDYKHARYTSTTVIDPPPGTTYYRYQIRNAGNAYAFGVIHSQDVQLTSFLDFGTRGTFMRSKIEDLKAQFPYSPELVGIVKADFHDPDRRFGVELVLKGADEFKSYDESSGTPKHLPGYGYFDGFARARITDQLTLVAGVENIFDRKIISRVNNPEEGRVYSVSANAQF